MKELRQGDPNYNNISTNESICDVMKSVLCLDSDVPFFTLLNREEIAKQMMNERINVGKNAAGFTECGCSCDKSKCFCNTNLIKSLNHPDKLTPLWKFILKLC